jgi:hypothetical protein
MIARVSMFILRRFGFRTWLLVSMWYEVLRSFAGYPPVRWQVEIGSDYGGRPEIEFVFEWDRKRWKLELASLEYGRWTLTV